MKAKRGKLLLIAPVDARMLRLSRELSRDWELHSRWPAEAPLGAPKELLSRESYSAILLADDPRARGCVGPLRRFTTAPIVFIKGEPASPGAPAAPRSGERSDQAISVAAEIWSFARAERAWLNRRLSSLVAPRAPRSAGLTSIVIPCLDKLDYTRKCLESVALHTSLPHEVIVVDNGSRDGTAAYVRSRRRVRLIRNRENLGFARAVNQGMQAATGRYVVWLNNDAVVTPGWLEGLIGCAERSPWIGAVGPCTNEAVGYQRVESPSYRGGDGLLAFSQAWSLRHRGRSIAAHRLTGFCLLLKSEVIKQIGLLDPRFSPACYEDFDYCLRIRQAGYELACALDVYVHHDGHQSYASRDAMLRQSAASREIFLDKWCHQALSLLDDLDAEAARVHARRARG